MNREKLLEELKTDEGTGPMKNGRMFPYQDTEGVLSIGYGRNLRDNGISVDEGEYLLANDLDDAVRHGIVYPWYVTLDVPRQAAITNMLFNLGPKKFSKFSDTIDAMKRKNYELAAVHMLDSLWADQVGRRARRLAEQIRSGVWL